MRTAIIFLFIIAGLVLIGSFVPQQNTSAAEKVSEFQAAHTNLDSMFAAAGLPLTQVFVSPVFFGMAALLYGSLGACVIRRFRALFVRTVKRYVRSAQFWGEWGSWVFHAAFFVLLFAVLWGKLTGFQGLVEVTEGTSFTEARAGYDQIQEGLLFNGQHGNFQIKLNHFSATYQPNGVAADYVSNVTVYDHGRPVLTHDMRVNDPLSYDGVDVYQQDYGWAPHMVVTNTTGQVVFDDYVQFLPGSTKSVGAGIMKVPDFGLSVPSQAGALQMGAYLSVFPDAHPEPVVNVDGSITPGATQYVPGGQEARFPVVQMKIYLGDLGLGKGPQNVNVLDTSRMVTLTQDGEPIPLVMGATDTLPVVVGGQLQYFHVSFPDLRQFSLFMVKKDSGVVLVYVSFGMIMFGLLTKLYVKPYLESRERRAREARRAAGQTGSGKDERVLADPVRDREPAAVG